MTDTQIDTAKLRDSDSTSDLDRNGTDCVPSEAQIPSPADSDHDARDSISGTVAPVMDMLSRRPGLRASTLRELQRHGSQFADYLVAAANDSWLAATAAMFEEFCVGGFTHPTTGRKLATAPGSKKVRRWGAVRVVRTARGLKLLAPDSDLSLHVDPPVIADPIKGLPDDDPLRIRQALLEYRPRTHSAEDEAKVQQFLPEIQDIVLATKPSTVSAATTTALCVTVLTLWSDDELGTIDRKVMFNPANVEACIHDPAHDWTTQWRRTVRSVLRGAGRAVCPELWPAAPRVIGHKRAPEPYDEVDEHLLREAALMEGRSAPCESLWLVGTTVGAGLSGAEAFRAGPRDLVNLGGGRLGIKVLRDRPRIVPIREQYTELAAKARWLCGDRPTFFDTATKARAYNRAAKIRVEGLGRLLIPRARATFVCAHIAAGTALADLHEFAGPLSAEYLQQMLRQCEGSVDAIEAAKRGLRA